MPVNSTDFLYSFLAMMIVGIALTASFASYANVLTQAAEVDRLKEILNHMAAKAMETVAVVAENNATLSVVIPLPVRIGESDYWIRLGNDSSGAWVEGAFGRVSRSGEQDYRIYLPKEVKASGTFEGGYELARIDCSLNGSTPQLVLSRQE